MSWYRSLMQLLIFATVDQKIPFCYNLYIMKVIKLDRRYHGFPEWTHALQFTQREVHPRYREQMPYIRAFTETFGERRWFENEDSCFPLANPDWTYDPKRRRIYIKDPSVMTFIQLRLR